MKLPSTYDKHPVINVTSSSKDCAAGWPDVLERLSSVNRWPLCVECYPGALVDEIQQAVTGALPPSQVFRASECMKSSEEIEALVAPCLGDDPVFGRMNGLELADFFDPVKLAATREGIEKSEGRVIVIGTGASLLAPETSTLIYADMARWEIQTRQRNKEIGNLGAENQADRASLKYKRAFFVDWRAADRLKNRLLSKLDFLLDTNDRRNPKLISGDLFRRSLEATVRRPFRVMPFFDPGPWGGEWMRRTFDLPEDAPNYAWCFDCVPEENSLRLGFGGVQVEIPAIDLVFSHPRELLGEAVHGRFGTEFPIRFDMLDTMGGGNLSLQVHPLTEYIQDRFGMHYTQDESYYLLDAGEGAVVYLGLKEDVNPAKMLRALECAQHGGAPFAAERFVNRWPVKKHDHLLIPAGTVHCSGKDSMVLEISATPYIFTFKLWDWGRLGLDGVPRTIHLQHGRENIQWCRKTEWVRRNLVNRKERVASTEAWCEERTGLHEREFIETRRHWFTGNVEHDTCGGVNVLNLVEGPEIIVESPADAFEPFTVHYAETFIVPAVVGRYNIRPTQPVHCATIKAFVRTNP
jgi:mannose-6-phosphate isomerase class I